jgi:anti-anti-sigma factor
VASASPVPFSYEVELSDDAITIKCHGRIVGDTPQELKDLVKPMIAKYRRIVVDFSDVPAVDSSGLGIMVGLKVSAISADCCSLEFTNFAPRVEHVLRATKLKEILGRWPKRFI